jgi:hypothetical protein
VIFFEPPKLEVSILLDRSKRNLKVYLRNDSSRPITLLDYPGRLMLAESNSKKPSGLVICFPGAVKNTSRFTLLRGGNLFFSYSLGSDFMGRSANSKVFARLDVNYEEAGAMIGKRLFQSKQFIVNLRRR